MYHQLAHLYDWPGTLDFARQILARDLALLEAADIPPDARLADLACGTGTLAIELARRGYHVNGIDLSPAMLDQARAKSRDLPVEVRTRLSWQEADMRFFILERPVHGLLCHYDSLNLLSNETELRATFIQVARALRAHGLFAFDLNTLENFRTFWNGRDSYEGPNYRLITEATFNEELARAEVRFTADEHTEDGLVRRNDHLVARYFNEAAVEKYLEAAGFYDIAYEPFTPLADQGGDFPLKTLWQCRRRPD